MLEIVQIVEDLRSRKSGRPSDSSGACWPDPDARPQ